MKTFTLFLIIPWLYSCSTIPATTQETINTTFSTRLTSNKSEKPLHTPPVEITDALIPSFNQSSSATSLPFQARKFSISTHDLDAREFFMGLVIDSDENMLVHPDVAGQISLDLKNVTVAQALDAVQKVYGYDYKKNEIGYIIYPASLQTKIFKINRLDLIRAGESSTHVSSGQQSSGEGGGEGSGSESEGSGGSQSSGSWVKTKSISNFWNEVEMAIKSIIATDDQASVVINRQTGIAVVRAKPMQLREVENFINVTQKQISRQVILEAKIIEVILDDSHQAGVNWHSIVREGIRKVPLLTGIGALATSFSDVFTIGGSWGDFRAYLELLETQGKTNILSSPKISTLNNQKAIIKVGQDEYFITEVSSNTEANPQGGNPTQTQEIGFSPFFSGIALDVTPQINDANEVTLHIHPSITRVQDQQKKFVINGQEGSLPMALSTIRESDSIIKAKNGQIVVLGGLMQESKKEDKQGVALLSQIPYLGNLFRVNKGENKKSELIILLKATVINSDDDWLPSLDSSNRQLNQLQSHPLWK